MKASQIHEAIDRGDLNLVWELMFQRTAWIQNTSFSADEAAKLTEETIHIRDRLVAIQEDTSEKIGRATLTQQAVRAYGEWGGQK